MTGITSAGPPKIMNAQKTLSCGVRNGDLMTLRQRVKAYGASWAARRSAEGGAPEPMLPLRGGGGGRRSRAADRVRQRHNT